MYCRSQFCDTTIGCKPEIFLGQKFVFDTRKTGDPNLNFVFSFLLKNIVANVNNFIAYTFRPNGTKKKLEHKHFVITFYDELHILLGKEICCGKKYHWWQVFLWQTSVSLVLNWWVSHMSQRK